MSDDHAQEEPRRKFLHASEIRKITDLDVLWDELDYATTQAGVLRARLEFPNQDADGNIDEDHYHRTRNALGYALSSIRVLEKQIPYLEREQSAKRELAKINFVRGMIWHFHFMRLAKSMLPPGTFDAIHERTDQEMAARYERLDFDSFDQDKVEWH